MAAKVEIVNWLSGIVGKMTLGANDGVDIGDVDVTSVAAPSAAFAGDKDVALAATPEALAATQALKAGVRIQAKEANTGVVWIQISGSADAKGFKLQIPTAGAIPPEVFVPIDDLAKVFVRVAVDGEGVTYLAS